jgi:hypothetical protein
VSTNFRFEFWRAFSSRNSKIYSSEGVVKWGVFILKEILMTSGVLVLTGLVVNKTFGDTAHMNFLKEIGITLDEYDIEFADISPASESFNTIFGSTPVLQLTLTPSCLVLGKGDCRRGRQ